MLQEGRGSQTGESLRVVASVVANQHLERAAVLDLLNVLVQTLCCMNHQGYHSVHVMDLRGLDDREVVHAGEPSPHGGAQA